MNVPPLDDAEEVLFRQIHPSFYDGGHPASPSFAPTAKDANRLSVDRSSLTTAAAAHALFTGNGFSSAAVYGVSVGEFGAERISCFPDPLGKEAGRPANHAHAYADFSAFSPAQAKKIAKRLRNNAVTRGKLYPPG